MQSLKNRVMPFIMLGLFIALFAFGFVLFLYLFLIGSVIGLALFILQWVKDKWQKKHLKQQPSNQQTKRIIDITDWKRH